VDYLGLRYVVSGAFHERGEGLLQLELVAPETVAGFVAGLGGTFLERNVKTDPPPR